MAYYFIRSFKGKPPLVYYLQALESTVYSFITKVSVQVEVVNCITCRAYAAGATWRSIGHLTTYGPTDSPTFATPFLSSLANREDTNEEQLKPKPPP